MNYLRESYLNDYHRQDKLAGLEHKRQINEALTITRQPNQVWAQMGHIWHALGNARRIRIEVHFDYNEPQPETSGC